MPPKRKADVDEMQSKDVRRSQRVRNQKDGVTEHIEVVDNPERKVRRKRGVASSPKSSRFPFITHVLYLKKQVSLSTTGLITDNDNAYNPDLNQVWFAFEFPQKVLKIGLPIQGLFQLVRNSESALQSLMQTNDAAAFRSALRTIFHPYVNFESVDQDVLEDELNRLSVHARLYHMLRTLSSIVDYGTKHKIAVFIDEDDTVRIPVKFLQDKVKRLQVHIQDDRFPDAALMRQYEEITHASNRAYMFTAEFIKTNAILSPEISLFEAFDLGRSPTMPVYNIDDLKKFSMIAGGLTIGLKTRNAWGVQPQSATDVEFMTMVDNRIMKLALRNTDTVLTDALVKLIAKRLWSKVVLSDTRIKSNDNIAQSLAWVAQTFIMRMLDKGTLKPSPKGYSQSHHNMLDMFQRLESNKTPQTTVSARSQRSGR